MPPPQHPLEMAARRAKLAHEAMERCRSGPNGEVESGGKYSRGQPVALPAIHR